MNAAFSLMISGEILFALLLIWGFAHEQLFVAFEDKAIRLVLKKLEARKSKKEEKRRIKLNRRCVYTPVKPSSEKVNGGRSAA